MKVCLGSLIYPIKNKVAKMTFVLKNVKYYIL